jgi:hypothetical protein
MMRIGPTLLMNVTLLVALAAVATNAFAGDTSPIFGSSGAEPFQLSLDPVTGKPLLLAGKR